MRLSLGHMTIIHRQHQHSPVTDTNEPVIHFWGMTTLKQRAITLGYACALGVCHWVGQFAYAITGLPNITTEGWL
jgi:hypothetical protein